MTRDEINLLRNEVKATSLEKTAEAAGVAVLTLVKVIGPVDIGEGATLILRRHCDRLKAQSVKDAPGKGER